MRRLVYNNTHVRPDLEGAAPAGSARDRKVLHMNAQRNETRCPRPYSPPPPWLACLPRAAASPPTPATRLARPARRWLPWTINVNVASLKGPTTIGLVQMMDTTSGIPTSDTTADDRAPRPRASTYSYTISSSADESSARDLRQGRHRARALQRRRDSLQDQCGRLGHRHQHARRALCRDGRHVHRAVHRPCGPHGLHLGQGREPEYTLDFSWTRRASPPTSRLSGRASTPRLRQFLPMTPLPSAFCRSRSPRPPLRRTPRSPRRSASPTSGNQYVTDGSEFVMGVTVARSEFITAHPTPWQTSSSATPPPSRTSRRPGFRRRARGQGGPCVANETIAAKAIPECNVVCMTGDDLRQALSGYLQVLYDADASSVGDRCLAMTSTTQASA